MNKSNMQIKIENIQKTFQRNQVLHGIDLVFDKPGITAVLGPNGSGKTTLMKCILGMVIPDKGNIYINDISIKGKWKYRNQIDYLPQIARFPENLKVAELLNMVKDLRKDSAHEQELISLFELEPFLQKRLGHLSGGTRQKVNIVQAFMFDSPIIILDEPTSGLDPVSLIRLKELIRREKDRGKTILVTSHIMGFVEEISDEIVFLLEGHVYFHGSLRELKESYGETKLENAIARILQKDHSLEKTIC